MNLSVTLHAKNKQDLAKQLRTWADHLVGEDETPVEAATDEAEETVADDEDEEFGASSKKKAAKKKAAASFEEEETVEAEEPEEESFEEKEKPAKKTATKEKELTEADVMKACKAHAKEHDTETTQKLLMKTFKTKSVSKLKPEQYAQAIKILEG
jgi:hypothetical protein